MSDVIVLDAASISDKHYPVTREQILKDVKVYSNLIVSGVEDTEGVKAVREARLKLRNLRTSIENRRVELKSGALEYGRKVDSVAKELTALITPHEIRLRKLEDDVEAERERRRRERLQSRLDRLRAIECDGYAVAFIDAMDDGNFDLLIVNKTAEFNERKERERIEAEERARIEAEEAEKRRIEEEQIESERRREEEERQRREAEEARLRAEEDARLKAEREKLEAEKAEQERIEAERRRVHEEEQRKLREEQEKIEAEKRRLREEEESRQRAERERIEREERERLEAEAADRERLRREALRPDREKLLGVVRQISDIPLPVMATADGQEAMSLVDAALLRCTNAIIEIVNVHLPESKESKDADRLESVA